MTPGKLARAVSACVDGEHVTWPAGTPCAVYSRADVQQLPRAVVAAARRLSSDSGGAWIVRVGDHRLAVRLDAVSRYEPPVTE